jgi:hypothetical protein
MRHVAAIVGLLALASCGGSQGPPGPMGPPGPAGAPGAVGQPGATVLPGPEANIVKTCWYYHSDATRRMSWEVPLSFTRDDCHQMLQAYDRQGFNAAAVVFGCYANGQYSIFRHGDVPPGGNPCRW